MPVITSPQPVLTFGALNLIGVSTDIATFGYTFEALGDDADWGNPVPIEDKVISWLQEGAIVSLKNYDNREMFIRIRVRSTTLNGLARGESALMLETGQPNLLTWTPPDGAAPACVFTVVMSHLEEVTADLSELHYERVYGLKIQAEPFVRAKDPVTVTRPAPVVSASITVTSIDACTATTGWSGTPNAVTTSSGAVRETKSVPAFTAAGTLTLSKAGLSVNMATTPYLRLDYGYTRQLAGPVTITVKINGVVSTPVAVSGNVAWFSFAGTLNTVDVSVTDPKFGVSVATTAELYVADISRSNAPADPSGQTGRQVSGALAIGGSAPTQGNLAISDPSVALGDVLIYTCPANPALIQPNLRTYLQAGPTPTVDATTVSGITSPLSTAHLFYLPVTGLAPGGYLLLARIKHASGGSYGITWSAYGRQGTVDLGVGVQQAVTTIALTAGVWKIAALAQLVLPAVRVGSAGTVAIGLLGPSGVLLDEAWLFNIETGDLTQVAAGTASPAPGGPANRVWLDAPTLDSPRPAVYLGNASDRSDSFHASSELSSFPVHDCEPDLMNVFSVTTNSIASVLTLTGYPRFHTHVAT